MRRPLPVGVITTNGEGLQRRPHSEAPGLRSQTGTQGYASQKGTAPMPPIMADPSDSEQPDEALRRARAAEQPPKTCGHWIGEERRHCHSAGGVRHYIPGYRCPQHTPRALQGLPEIPPGPGWPAAAWSTPSPQSASALFDDRAVASGRRRSSAHVYAAAKAAEERRKAAVR